MKLGIMQPYFFPYIGYFQLINAVDKFVIYDDVNYIKQGWINRNRILLNGQPHYITINLNDASSFKKINEIEINFNFNPSKLLKTLQQCYKKAPYFNEIYPLIEKVLFFEERNLAKFTTNSLKLICEYLNINSAFEISSQHNIGRKLRGEYRVIEICKYFGAEEYINAIGGVNLYNKEEFISKFADRIFFSPKKMGAQTAEANINAGIAAATQIVNFLENGDETFKVN